MFVFLRAQAWRLHGSLVTGDILTALDIGELATPFLNRLAHLDNFRFAFDFRHGFLAGKYCLLAMLVSGCAHWRWIFGMIDGIFGFSTRTVSLC